VYNVAETFWNAMGVQKGFPGFYRVLGTLTGIVKSNPNASTDFFGKHKNIMADWLGMHSPSSNVTRLKYSNIAVSEYSNRTVTR